MPASKGRTGTASTMRKRKQPTMKPGAPMRERTSAASQALSEARSTRRARPAPMRKVRSY